MLHFIKLSHNKRNWNTRQVGIDNFQFTLNHLQILCFDIKNTVLVNNFGDAMDGFVLQFLTRKKYA
jgi:hypothetical protein